MADHLKTAKMEPTSEQRAVIESWGKGMAVMAGAGCGKTTTLVSKCLALVDRSAEARFAAVSFTERSASDLRVKLSKNLLERSGGQPGEPGVPGVPGVEDPLSRHWVATIHGLCGAIIREFPREAGFDGEEGMLSEAESQLLWERAIEALWLDEIPEDIRALVDTLLSRESRESLSQLLRRVRALRSFGVIEFLDTLPDPSSRALSLVGRFVLERYDRLKRRQGALDFDDLERGADVALRDPRVQRYYHQRFDLVLVDEFQDTNPVQARILWRFIRPDASNLCVVGDPKQSIYRFRDADLSVFEEFCAKLPVKLSLTLNFRSRPGIIDFANQVCAPAFQFAGMVYEALAPKRSPTEEFDPVVRLEGAGPAELARWIAGEKQRGVPLDQMALLLRKIRGNEKWLRALAAEGISLALGSGGMFWEDPRIRELVAFLKWWDNPGHAMSGAVFLRAPWVGIADLQLDQWLEEDPLLLAPFLNSSHPLAPRLKKLRERIHRPGEALMELLISEEIEAELGAPLLGLWHRVEAFSTRGLDFHAVVTELVLALEENRRERDVPPPRNLGQLNVLTLHGSKGLEFPHVILVDLGEKQRASDTPLLYWDRIKGAFLGGRDLEGDRTHEKDPGEKNWKSVEQSKNLAESMRLFYVALTRAKERLILVCPPLKPVKEAAAGKKEKNIYEVDHWRGWIDCRETNTVSVQVPVPAAGFGYSVPAEFPNFQKPIGGRPVFAPARMRRPRHSVTEWNLLSRCPRAYEWQYLRQPPAAPAVLHSSSAEREFLKLDFETGELSQRELGTRVHAALEVNDFDELKKLEEEAGTRRFFAQPVIDWAAGSPLMTTKYLKSWNELAFEIVIDGEILVGAMDRVIETAENELTLVDFKVTGSAKSEAQLRERYGVQMQLYALALQKLQPEARCKAYIVNISPGGVTEVPIDLTASVSGMEKLASLAREIVAGSAGISKPSAFCKDCEFKTICPEAQN
ncbi:MAG: hypothetical protein A2070_05285 [Bdellovibrionales bacterium GWC1_52_8]|nr:MAG: hypothetical protein A2070_05285 [Bdellovibrionales bacterium GWC1_52_8]